MTRRCNICGKGPVAGNTISHSHKKTRRRWLPNIQVVKAIKNGVPQKMKVCTQCLKSGKVKKTI